VYAIPTVMIDLEQVCVMLHNNILLLCTQTYLKLYDVISVDKPIDLADTSEALPLHNDLTYFESPPGLQFLHCIRCIKDNCSLTALYCNTVYNVTAAFYPV